MLHGRMETIVNLPRRAQVLIDCTSGAVWVTRSGDARDYLLTAGMHMELRGAGWVAEPLRGGAFELLAIPRRRPARAVRLRAPIESLP